MFEIVFRALYVREADKIMNRIMILINIVYCKIFPLRYSCCDVNKIEIKQLK